MDQVIERREIKIESHQFGNDTHPLLQRIYLGRGISCPTEIERELDKLIPYHTLKDIAKAVERIYQALIRQESILIVGDFDTDGATSTALAILCLKAFGANNVSYLVPNRFEFGYGLTDKIVHLAKERDPDLIITVDNGISSIEGVDVANAENIDVIITDHHLPGSTLPNAYAIVNPNQAGDTFESKSMAGVGVIYYVMLALRRELIETAWFEEKKLKQVNMAQYLDLVALGTVADVVPLDKNNRIMVYQGLRNIRRNRCRPGIMALLEISKRQSKNLVSSDLGYAIAPRLNAAGRLDDMSLGIECLLSDELGSAREMAKTLDELNLERRQIESEMQEQALSAIKKIQIEDESTLPLGLCLYQKDWHQGVVGIIAGRIKDKYHRPVVAFTKVDDNELKGSARSIKGIHIRDVLDALASQYPNLINKFGGHAMAAGLSIEVNQFESFKKYFNEEVSKYVDESELQGKIISDGELIEDEFTLEIAEIIREGGPWGQNFPAPLFDGEFEIVEQRIVGAKHLKMSLSLPKQNCIIDAIAFNIDINQWPNHRCQKIHAAYRIDCNEYLGRRTVQLIIESMQAI